MADQPTRFHVAAEGQSFEFEVVRGDEGIVITAADGRRWVAGPEQGIGASLQRVAMSPTTADGTQEEPFQFVFGQRRTSSGIEIVVDGAVYGCDIRDARSVRFARMVTPPAASSRSIIKAQMPGLVVAVLVKPGDTVTRDQPLLTVSAMKLENDIRSPAAGTVESVAVTPGQPVEKGAVLAVIA